MPSGGGYIIKALRHYYDLAELLSAFEIRMGTGDLIQREAPVNAGANDPRRNAGGKEALCPRQRKGEPAWPGH